MREYVFQSAIVNPGANITLLQIVPSAAIPITILEAWCEQQSSTTSTQLGIQLLRKSAAATVTIATKDAAAASIARVDPADATTTVQLGTSLTGFTASAEGTDSEILERRGFNILNGVPIVHIPEVRITVPAAGIFAMKIQGTPPAGTYLCGIKYGEGI